MAAVGQAPGPRPGRGQGALHPQALQHPAEPRHPAAAGSAAAGLPADGDRWEAHLRRLQQQARLRGAARRRGARRRSAAAHEPQGGPGRHARPAQGRKRLRKPHLQSAPLSVVCHSFRLISRRASVSRSGLEGGRLSSARGSAAHPRFEATSSRPCPAQVLRDAAKTKAILDAALATPRCCHGSHERVGPGIAKAFASFYALPGLGGFELYRDIDEKSGKTTAFEGVAAVYTAAVEREHVAHDWLAERVSHRRHAAPSAEKEAWRAARDEQAAVCVELREAYRAWTGRVFKMKAECDKWESDQCNRRRHILDGGRNHMHWLSKHF